MTEKTTTSEPVHQQEQSPSSSGWLHAFASLHWYDEMIKFAFNFVTKTSELLLAAGVVISTANFLTDGDVMSHNKMLSDSWSWAQALAIDSSLGIVFMNAFQAVRERERIKAAIFFLLTILLASVAGLITHFDALSHASGLPVTDKGVSGIIPLWMMTALRAVAVIGFLLGSRLKHISLNALRQETATTVQQVSSTGTAPAPLNYQALAAAVISMMEQADTPLQVHIEEEGEPQERPKLILLRGAQGTLPPAQAVKLEGRTSCQNDDNSEERHPSDNASLELHVPQDQPASPVNDNEANGKARYAADHQARVLTTQHTRGVGMQSSKTPAAPHAVTMISPDTDERLRTAYQELHAEGQSINGKTLGSRAKVRRQTALAWLQQQRKQDQ